MDEKSQVQALARSQPAFPMIPGMPEKRSHDYVRHGTTSRFAALNVAESSVISATHRRPGGRVPQLPGQDRHLGPRRTLDVHIVCDNYATHKYPTITRWLDAHPRFTIHFTPTYSSWLNQVERVFAEITRDLLQRSDHRSVQAFEADLRNWIKPWNDNPKPFIWTKTADQILESLGRLLQRTTVAGHWEAMDSEGRPSLLLLAFRKSDTRT